MFSSRDMNYIKNAARQLPTFLSHYPAKYRLECDHDGYVLRLPWAVRNGDLERTRETIEEQKIDVNTKIHGRYLLHYATDFGHQDVVQYLLDKGADPNVVDDNGITPLLIAIWESHTECVELLLKFGAVRTCRAPNGKTYLDQAENDEIIKLLQD